MLGLGAVPLLAACADVAKAPRAPTPTAARAAPTAAPTPPPVTTPTMTVPVAETTAAPPVAPTPTVALGDFDEVVQQIMHLWSAPGLAVGIVHDGAVVYRKGFGTRDGPSSAAVTPQTLFAIGSCTKAFTTLGLAILADEQKLDWDRPIRSYLPTFKLIDAFATERMTARDLTTHRSGLPRHDLVWYTSTASRAQLVSRLQYLQPSADFRYLWQYQNLMYMTAGYLIEQISGMSWEDFTQQRIFAPLGLHATTFFTSKVSQLADFAPPYGIDVGSATSAPHRLPIQVSPAEAPAGGIVSTIDDMCRWLRFQLGNGDLDGVHVVSEEQLAQMHQPQMVMPNEATYAAVPPVTSYGLGWEIGVYRGHLIFSHEGQIDGFNAQVTLLPESNSGIVALADFELTPLNVLALNALDRLLGLNQEPWVDRAWSAYTPARREAAATFQRAATSSAAAPPLPLDRYAGVFTNPGYGPLTISVQDGKLEAKLNALTFSMVHGEGDAFRLIWSEAGSTYPATFSVAAGDEPDQFAAAFEPAVAPIAFKRT